MKRLVLCLALLVPGMFAAGPAAAIDTYFLHLDGIDGESTTIGHEKWISILSFSLGASNPSAFPTGGGSGSGKVSFSDLSMVKEVDVSSVSLLKYLATGKHIAKATLDIVSSATKSSQPYLRYDLQDTLVTSYQISGGSGGNPIESFSLNFGRIEFEYFTMKPDGSLGPPVKFGYDLNTASPAPEPSTWAMLGAGLLLVAWRGRRLVRARTG